MSEAAVATPNKTEGMTKLEAVRRALEKLGKNAGRLDLQSYVKSHFGFEMTPDHISNYKNKLINQKGKGKTKKTAAPKSDAPAAKAVAPSTASAPAVSHLKTGKGISLDDIESVKTLVGRVGPDQLRSLVDLLAK